MDILMCRCAACNADVKLYGEEDLCSNCRNKIYEADNYKEYTQGSSREGHTQPSQPIDNYSFKRNKDIENLFDI